mgnify:CR=1 FL=1|jgi:ribosomal protein S17E
MENDTNNLSEEFKQKVILILEENDKIFETNWNENQNKLVELNKSTPSKINGYLNRYLNLSKEKIDGYTNWVGNRTNSFSLTLFTSIIGITTFCFFAAVAILGYDWGLVDQQSPLYYKIGTMFFIFILQVVLIHFAVQNSKDNFSKGLEKFHEDDHEKTDNSMKELDDTKCSIDSDIEEINKIYTGFKSSLTDTCEVVRNLIPTCKEIDDLHKFQEKWYLECHKLKIVTTYFGLKAQSNELTLLAKKPIIEKKRSNDEKLSDSIIEYICEKTCLDIQLMNLFVYCYNEDKKAERLWKSIRQDPNKVHYLTKKLFDLDKLDFAKKSNSNKSEDSNESKFSEEILENILLKTQNFDLLLITNNVSLYLRLCSFLQSYFKKLIDEKIPLRSQLHCENTVKNIDFEKDFESIFVDIFSKELHKSLNIDADENIKEAYVVALMAIILNPDIKFRDTVCKKAAENNNSIYILMAYHKLREQEAVANESFTLSDIFKAEKPSEIKEKIENDNAEKEIFRYMALSLSRGEWYESSQIIMQKMLEDLSKRIRNKEKFEAFKKAFINIFEKVNINTLDRAVDAGLFSVYFILTNSSKGEFIDKVVERLLISNFKNDEDIKNFEKENHISLYYDLKDGSRIPKYDFTKYSNSTRIGILHKDIEFSTFANDITTDVEKLLEKETKYLSDETKWKDIGLIVLRISPSEYSFGILDKEIEKKGKLQLINLDIASCITSLASGSGYLEDEQKLAVSTLDSTINILDVIDQLKIYEYLSTDIQKSLTRQESVFLQSKDLKEEIKKYLESKEVYSFKELSHILNYSSDNEKENLRTSLYAVFANAYSNKYPKKTLKPSTQKRCVNEFLDLLESLNELWA